MSNVTYSFVSENDAKDVVFESKATSFGIDHVTRKDIKSFYINFSSKGYFDTGLMPVDGSGMLSIRSAGNHTQIAYQHNYGMYYINWGSYERDPNAAKIYVAQPYRIVIADIYNGNILGARTFYSPIPVQHPQTPLFHVNLPNINCKGYRGNGVGWICLYHTEDISAYPFNEKVAKILERCSGVEAYNDQNMSETDGPRFYHQHGKPVYITDPERWQDHSAKNDVTWVLDPDLWIPVLVEDMDHQDKHVEGGQPLTFADAILGNYQAYYTDPIRPKLVNKIAREDLELNNNDIFNLFKASYNASTEFGNQFVKPNSFESSIAVREQLSQVFVAPPSQESSEDDESEEDLIGCDACGESINVNTDEYTNTFHGDAYCQSCAENSLVWIEHISAYLDMENDNVVFSELRDEYFYLPKWEQKVRCDTCDSAHIYDTSAGCTKTMLPIWTNDDLSHETCVHCLDHSTKFVCGLCKSSIANPDNYQVKSISSHRTNFTKTHVCNACFYSDTNVLERSGILTAESMVKCVCGSTHAAENFTQMKLNNMPTGAYQNFGFHSSIGELIKINPTLASNYAVFAEELTQPLADVSFSIAARTLLLCPECQLADTTNHNEFLSDYIKNVESKLIKIIEETGNLDLLHGTNINIYTSF